MPVYDRTDLGPVPTVPDNLDQPVKFGGITELVKDAFVLELRHFMRNDYNKMRYGELPRIDKYAVALDVDIDPLETAVSLIRNYPDVTENLPIVAVLAATGQNMKLDISSKYVGMVIPQAMLISSTLGPYTLTNGMDLEIETIPSGRENRPVVSRFKFPDYMFKSVSAATVDEVVEAINFQALYCTAKRVVVEGQPRVALIAGGKKGTQFPNRVTIVGGTAATALGLSTGQTDKNFGPGKRAYHRHMISANLTLGIEVVAESENVRTELSDLIFDFFTFVMADRQFQFFGRSIFDPTIQDETYQIILRDGEISLSGEQETPRPGDQKDKIYVNRINVPVTAIQYTDRIITDSAGNTATPVTGINIVSKDDLPEPN